MWWKAGTAIIVLMWALLNTPIIYGELMFQVQAAVLP